MRHSFLKKKRKETNKYKWKKKTLLLLFCALIFTFLNLIWAYLSSLKDFIYHYHTQKKKKKSSSSSAADCTNTYSGESAISWSRHKGCKILFQYDFMVLSGVVCQRNHWFKSLRLHSCCALLKHHILQRVYWALMIFCLSISPAGEEGTWALRESIQQHLQGNC